MKKIVQLSLWVFGTVTMLPNSVFAHTGVNELTGFIAGFSHPLGGADHILAMVAVGLLAFQIGGRAIWIVPGAFVVLMVFGGGLAIAGIDLPFVEQAILISVLVLGALIAVAFRFPLATVASLVGIFAFFHGHAHGAEMPLVSDTVSYGFGFAMATMMLHAMGITGGMALQKLDFVKAVRLAGVAIALSGGYLMIT